MKNKMRKFNKHFFILGLVLLIGCANRPTATDQPAENPQVAAILKLRAALSLPDLPLESKGVEHVINSPTGDLDVSLYTDSQGRKFSVEPHSLTVVEMDARDLLASIPADAPVFSQEKIKEMVNQMLAQAIPDFKTISRNLTYEEGGKVDNYFFSWYGAQSPAYFNRPFIQIGVYKTGFIFAYYNTITFVSP